MPDNQVIPTVPTNKIPSYVWIIITVLGLSIVFLLIFRSGDASGNKGGLVQNEINDKVKTLRDDSVKKYRVTKFLETWENNLKLLGTKLGQETDNLVKNYKLPLSVNDVNFTDDSVNNYAFAHAGSI